MAEADPPARTISLGADVAAVDAAAWDALHDGGNPFVSHAFADATKGAVGVLKVGNPKGAVGAH